MREGTHDTLEWISSALDYELSDNTFTPSTILFTTFKDSYISVKPPTNLPIHSSANFPEVPVGVPATQPPAPAPTRVAARPTPETFVGTPTAAGSGKTTEIYVEVPTPAYVEPDIVTVYETIDRSGKRGQWW